MYWRDVFPGARSAACLDADPDVFFPDTPEELLAVTALCDDCPCREACLEYALVHRITEGVWGGKTPSQRGKICGQTPARRHPVTCDSCFRSFVPAHAGVFYCSTLCGQRAARQAAALNLDPYQAVYRQEQRRLQTLARLRGVETAWRPRWEREAKPLVKAARAEGWDLGILKAQLKELPPKTLRPDPRWLVTKGADRPKLVAQLELEEQAARFGKEPEMDWVPSPRAPTASAWNGGGYREWEHA